jgi:hypothetical protein
LSVEEVGSLNLKCPSIGPLVEEGLLCGCVAGHLKTSKVKQIKTTLELFIILFTCGLVKGKSEGKLN